MDIRWGFMHGLVSMGGTGEGYYYFCLHPFLLMMMMSSFYTAWSAWLALSAVLRAYLHGKVQEGVFLQDWWQRWPFFTAACAWGRAAVSELGEGLAGLQILVKTYNYHLDLDWLSRYHVFFFGMEITLHYICKFALLGRRSEDRLHAPLRNA